jgi:four helix bundle protein
MPREGTYRDLVAWQKSRRLVSEIYRSTSEWPADERFGLTSQLRRAAISIPANIAEGQGRLGTAEMKHRLSIAHGSLCELETLLIVAGDIGLIAGDVQAVLLADAEEVGRLRGFIRSPDGQGPTSIDRGV